jgi:hypothetical protein
MVAAAVQAQLGQVPDSAAFAPFHELRDELTEPFRRHVFLWPRKTGPKGDLVDDEMRRVLQVPGCSKLKVIAISPLLNSANQSAQVRAQQLEQDSCLKINAFVEARLIRPNRQGGSVAVPESALVQRGSDKFVFVRNQSGFAVVPVQARAAGGGMVWISGPVAAGDKVATRGIVALKGVWAGLGAPEAEPATAAKEGK